MTQYIPFDHHGITGGISVKLRNNLTLDAFSMMFVPGYDPDRFETLAIRLFAGKETVITVYAVDKMRQEGHSYDTNKLPVKKFKLQDVDMQNLFSLFEEFNFTLSSGNYQIEDMEVVNK